MPSIVWILTLAQALSMSVAPLLVFSGGLVGSELAPDPAWSTLPLALMVVGTALGVMPLTRLMQMLGRKMVFILGAIVASSGALLSAWGIYLESFVVFCVAGICMGLSLAVAQQYRFAAMEVVAPDKTGRAASQVLLGGLVAAYLGPELVLFGRGVTQAIGLQPATPRYADFIGAFILLAAICGLALLVIGLAYRNHRPEQSEIREEGRPLMEILRNPLLWLAICAAAMGYAMMSFMMTATPLNMHKVIGHSLVDTKWVIQSHIIAMFLPSLFSGWLIGKLGHRRLIGLGVLAYVICIGVAFSGHHLMHYWWALVLLGVGWNFLFVGGTALLPPCYRPVERFKVQSVNEFVVFGVQAVAALSSGWVVNRFGWNVLLAVSLGMVVLVLAALWYNRKGQTQPQVVTG